MGYRYVARRLDDVRDIGLRIPMWIGHRLPWLLGKAVTVLPIEMAGRRVHHRAAWGTRSLSHLPLLLWQQHGADPGSTVSGAKRIYGAARIFRGRSGYLSNQRCLPAGGISRCSEQRCNR